MNRQPQARPDSSLHSLDRVTGARLTPLRFPKTDRAVSPRQAEIILLILLLACYVSLNLIFRWVRWPLFVGAGYANNWPPLPLSAKIYQFYMTCLPVFLWAVPFYVLAFRAPHLINKGAIAVFVLVTMGITEMDMTWVHMSHGHATLVEARSLLTENWREHFGIQNSDILRFLEKLGFHACVCVTACWLSWFLAKLGRLRRFLYVRPMTLVITVLSLVIVDSALATYLGSTDGITAGRPSSWRTVAGWNPYRLGWLDRSWPDLTPGGSDLRAANRALQAVLTTTAAHSGSASHFPPHRVADSTLPYDVVMIVVESLNYNLINRAAMPNWSALASQSVVLRNHYSTGNATHLGVLGLLFGSPPTFYKGADTSGLKASPFLRAFRDHGYRTKRISGELTAHRMLGAYLSGFTEPTFEAPDGNDNALIPEFRRMMMTPGRKFAFLFYYGTHFPYLHSAGNVRYSPEVPSNFDFGIWNLQSHAKEIINRYLNCLTEFDVWLGAVLNLIDLSRTIVVVAGDHGEELFETGLLSHTHALTEAMIRTPALVYVPKRPAEIYEPVTSHADLMISVTDALGWSTDIETYGNTIFDRSARRSAVAAKNNQTNPVEAWAVVTGNSKVLVNGERRGRVRIVALSDRAGQEASFTQDPGRWGESLQEVQRLQLQLMKD